MRSAVEWAQVRAMAADGVSQREIAARLGINRRTVKRLMEAGEPPRYERPSALTSKPRSSRTPTEPQSVLYALLLAVRFRLRWLVKLSSSIRPPPTACPS